MDLKPHQVMRLLQLGQVEEVLAASGPWRCVGCQTCLARCPNAVDIPAVLARVRQAQLGRRSPVGAGGIVDFDELFLDMVRRRGRVNDGLVAFRYRMRTGGLFDDWRLGLKMLKAGKMRLRTAPVIDRDGVARLFEAGGEEDE
jgi:heterodisulfide reductase subunit C